MRVLNNAGGGSDMTMGCVQYYVDIPNGLLKTTSTVHIRMKRRNLKTDNFAVSYGIYKEGKTNYAKTSFVKGSSVYGTLDDSSYTDFSFSVSSDTASTSGLSICISLRGGPATNAKPYVDITDIWISDSSLTSSLRLSWEECYNDNNQTKFDVTKLEVNCSASGTKSFDPFKITVGSNTVVNAAKSISVSGSGWKDISSLVNLRKGYVFTHNADRTASTSIVVDIIMTGSGEPEKTWNQTVTQQLLTIPNISSATLSSSSITIDSDTVNISITRPNTQFVHKLWYTINESGHFTDGLSAGVDDYATTSATFTPPRSLQQYITSGTSISCLLYVETYLQSGSAYSKMGTSHASFTLKVKDSEIPTVISSGVYGSCPTNTVFDMWGQESDHILINNQSKVNISISTAQADDWATIKSYKTSITGFPDINTQTGQTGVISYKSGDSPTVKTTVTDTRGRTSEVLTTGLTFYDYVNPTLTNIECYRCDANGDPDPENGTYIRVKATPHISGCGGKNSFKVFVWYKENGSSAYIGDIKLVDPEEGEQGTKNIIPAPPQAGIFELTKNYTIKIVIEDGDYRRGDTHDTNVLNTASYEKSIASMAVTFSLKSGGKGACFGGYSTRDNALQISKEWDLMLGDEIEPNPLSTIYGGTGVSVESLDALRTEMDVPTTGEVADNIETATSDKVTKGKLFMYNSSGVLSEFSVRFGAYSAGAANYITFSTS